jgi:hypothetical protein
LSLKELIRIAGQIKVSDPRITLRAGVVNHDIVYSSMNRSDKTQDNYHENAFSGELVNYVIL